MCITCTAVHVIHMIQSPLVTTHINTCKQQTPAMHTIIVTFSLTTLLISKQNLNYQRLTKKSIADICIVEKILNLKCKVK